MTQAFNRRIPLIGKNRFDFGDLPLLQILAKLARTCVIQGIPEPEPFS